MTEEEMNREDAVVDIKYEDAGLDDRILRAVAELGYEVMTPIQKDAIPVMLEGRDLIGQAQTGTGKTAAFGIPIVQSVDAFEERPQALILCPTRELAIQAADDIRQYAKYFSGIRVLPIYGGQDITKQIRSLKGNSQIVVGTPGRVMDHIRRHTLKLDAVKIVVLDEADEMLDMGFREDIETILKDIPQEHQTALFSATMPKPILQITKDYQKEDAVFVKIPAKELTVPLVRQYFYEIPKGMKVDAVSRLLDYYNPKLTLIFTNTKRMADELAETLIGRGYFADVLHGDLSQQQRDHVMAGFRNGSTEILIATDVAARGLDVDDVEAVINYDVPDDIEYYVHRIGRTGRAGRKGRAFTLVVGRDIYKIRDIERFCHTHIESRHIPTGKDVKASKAQSILDSVTEVAAGEDLSDMISLIESKMSDMELTSLDIAAAFLKKAMGTGKDEVKDSDFITHRQDEPDGRRRSRRERDRRRSGRMRRDEGRSEGRRRDRDRFESDGRRTEKSDRFRDDGRRPDRDDRFVDDRSDRFRERDERRRADRSDRDRNRSDKKRPTEGSYFDRFADKKIRSKDINLDGSVKSKKDRPRLGFGKVGKKRRKDR